MIEKKDQTEYIIKETAKRLFFKEGKFNATTQEIADAAGVNRTLINYYFRSRNNLFKTVFDEAKKMEVNKIDSIMLSNLDFKQKISHFIDTSLEMNHEYPYLETYIVSQINQGLTYKRENVKEQSEEFFKNVKKAMEEGIIEPMEPIQFLLNMVSLINFPLAMRPLLQENLQITDEVYQQLLKDRKEIVLKTLFKN
ncbi:TetR/AcrR family transcriptional regulator [Faecalibacter sp. LW9]|uniref:TetR/AcrR family transcriptional regulator n=1 Tax=Faecalibacter sp. LW9 TaxID=3103144 RepID=UPI002AFE6152|nr:TetR/AcrR family transcriptional regulator [Faecalibacter sp. LW9]